ncbi:phosphoglucosamine mutase [Pseudomaricurvus sp. HS19]|uniref:phosphoglucosamine mutase n=1 Tax=Pseudomaricurvus sp. HS19 TaxID=2692626 RepID=UPI00136A3CF3|nr:phosphoglucosamine mutase [Pseudomaricurvus sp. HS19]MYM65200.1 phosphoglucosamine mutase [Pseudomaricurvus sp. HS19]
MSRKYFGTDGIRGRVGEGAITPDFVLRLGWAAGKVLAERFQGPKRILIGKDTRTSGYMFESALEAGLINAGVDVWLLGPMPTPAIAYLTRTFQAQAGIVISASHNPFYDNGIKFFSANGSKLPDDMELAIEEQLNQAMVTAPTLGKARRIEDAAGRYIEFCKGTLPWGFSLSGLKLVLDCANGATYHIAPSVFREMGAEVDVIAASPNGENINFECGSTKPEKLQARVLELGADLGIAFDGDGDRVAFVDHKGELVDGDEILYLIASYRQRYAGGCSGVVGTLMSNFGFEKALQALEVPFARANVGDRYVLEQMQARGWTLGGENSGHIVCADVTTTGDGIVAALQVLLSLSVMDESLHVAKQVMRKVPQKMINVRVADQTSFAANSRISDAVAVAESELGDSGRVLLRASGTEPVIRVMVEGEELSLVNRLTEELAAVVEQALSTGSA